MAGLCPQAYRRFVTKLHWRARREQPQGVTSAAADAGQFPDCKQQLLRAIGHAGSPRKIPNLKALFPKVAAHHSTAAGT